MGSNILVTVTDTPPTFRTYVEAWNELQQDNLKKFPETVDVKALRITQEFQLNETFMEYCRATFIHLYEFFVDENPDNNVEAIYDEIYGQYEPLKRVRVVIMHLLEDGELQHLRTVDRFVPWLYELSTQHPTGSRFHAAPWAEVPSHPGDLTENARGLFRLIHRMAIHAMRSMHQEPKYAMEDFSLGILVEKGTDNTRRLASILAADVRTVDRAEFRNLLSIIELSRLMCEAGIEKYKTDIAIQNNESQKVTEPTKIEHSPMFVRFSSPQNGNNNTTH